MRYLISVLDESTGSATADEAVRIDEFNERLRAGGHWVFAGGLAAPANGTVIDHRDGRGLTTQGPFVETREYVAGLWIIEADDDDVARALAAEGSRACHRRVELRRFLGG